jgi:hypothetical protein
VLYLGASYPVEEGVVRNGNFLGAISWRPCLLPSAWETPFSLRGPVPNEKPLRTGTKFFFLFICAYNAWVISPPFPHPLPYHPLRALPLPPTPSIPGRNYFALISNFVEERVEAIIGRNKGFCWLR